MFRYTLLVGKPPFETESLRETYARIKRGDYKIPSTLDDKATKMIHSMLHSDPKRRPTVRALMNMDFMTKGNPFLCFIFQQVWWKVSYFRKILEKSREFLKEDW